LWRKAEGRGAGLPPLPLAWIEKRKRVEVSLVDLRKKGWIAKNLGNKIVCRRALHLYITRTANYQSIT
jgi:16S rRNA G527 N7-methylase RsmG